MTNTKKELAISKFTNGEQYKTSLIDLIGGGFKYTQIGQWFVKAVEDEDQDWDFYSKAWHRSHGPKKTIYNRRVVFAKFDKLGRKTEKIVNFDGWRGQWLLKAIEEAKIVKSRTYKNKPHRSIQLNKVFQITKIRDIAGVQIWTRTLDNEIYDYCAVKGENTFHAESKKAAVTGLRNKIEKAELKAKGSLINLKLANDLGFCNTGIQEFCEDFNLSIKSSYTPQELSEKVVNRIQYFGKYESELNTLTKAVGYEI